MRNNAYRTFKIIIVPILLTLIVSVIAVVTLEYFANSTYRDLYIKNNEAINDLQLN